MRLCAWLPLVTCGCGQQPAVPPAVPIAAAPALSGEPAPLPSALDDLAGTWKVRFSVTQESSCSQSYASSSRSGSYALTLLTGGSAHAVVDTSDSDSFGPSPGRYQAGDRDFSHHASHVRYEWRGTASLDRAGLHLSLRADPRACVAVAADGSAASAVACPGEGLAITCRRGDIEASGTEMAGSPSKETLVVLRCPWIGLRYPFALDALKDAPLAREPGVTVEASNTTFEDTLTIRKTPVEVR